MTTPPSPLPPLRVIWRLIRYTGGLYWFNASFWIMHNLLDLVPGLLAKLFFDLLTGSEPVRFTVSGIVLLVVATAVTNVIALLGGIFLDTRTRFTHSTLLRRNLLSGILRQPGARAYRGAPGEVISTFRDDADVLENAADWLIDTISTMIFGLVAIAIMFTISPRITLFTLLPLLIVLLVTRAANNRIKSYRHDSRQATERVTGALGEILGAVQAIQVANAEAHVRDHFQRLSQARRQMMVRDTLLTQLLQSIFANSATLGTGLILLLGASAMREGNFSVGDFALFVAYLDLLAVFTTFFGGYLAQLKQAGVSFERMVELLSGGSGQSSVISVADSVLAANPVYLKGEPPAIAQPLPTAADQLQTLTVRGLTYAHNDHNGIFDIDLTIEQGEFVVITGRVGSGKTTLLRTLLGLLPLQAGEICWNGRPITNPANFFVPPRTAYTAQIPQLFSMTLRENVLLGLDERKVGLTAVFHQAVMEQDIVEMSSGLETLIGPKGVRLSGGQIQRTAAARMFARQPALLVFDDLSSALDVNTEQLLWERLRGDERSDHSPLATRHSPLALRPTFLVVSHRRPALRRADKIVVLKDGRVADSGPLDALLTRCEEMQYLWRDENLTHR